MFRCSGIAKLTIAISINQDIFLLDFEILLALLRDTRIQKLQELSFVRLLELLGDRVVFNCHSFRNVIG